MLTAALAESGAALGANYLAEYSNSQGYAHLMARTLPHPEHGVVVVKPQDAGLVYHPLRGFSTRDFAAALRGAIFSSFARVDRNGEPYIIDDIRVNPLSTRMEATRGHGVMYSSHASVALPFVSNGSDADKLATLSPNTLHLPDDSQVFISLQNGGRIFSGQPEIVIIRNGYGVILTSDAEGNIISSGHFLIGRRNNFNDKLGNVDVLNNLVVGAAADFDPKNVRQIAASMSDRISVSNLDQRFVGHFGTNIGSVMYGKLQSGLVIGAAEITGKQAGEMFRVLVIKAPQDVSAQDRKIVLDKPKLRELAMEFGYTFQGNMLPTALFETAAAFARAVGEPQ